MSIRVENASYTYGLRTPFEKEALFDINLEINKGEMWLIVGHTGSGKTTLISLMNGLLLPQSGDVKVEGMSTKDKRINIKDIRKKNRNSFSICRISILFAHGKRRNFIWTQQFWDRIDRRTN